MSNKSPEQRVLGRGQAFLTSVQLDPAHRQIDGLVARPKHARLRVAADPTTNDRWFDALEQFTTNVNIITAQNSVSGQLHATAPDESSAETIEADLSNYFDTPNPSRVMPPGLLENRASETELAAYRKARVSWPRLQGASLDLATNAVLGEIQGRITQARRRGNQAEEQRLDEEYRDEWRRLELAAVKALRDTPEAPLDTNLVAAYLSLPENRYTNRDYREAVLALAPRFGA